MIRFTRKIVDRALLTKRKLEPFSVIPKHRGILKDSSFSTGHRFGWWLPTTPVIRLLPHFCLVVVGGFKFKNLCFSRGGQNATACVQAELGRRTGDLNRAEQGIYSAEQGIFSAEQEINPRWRDQAKYARFGCIAAVIRTSDLGTAAASIHMGH